MPVPVSINDLSPVASINSPARTESPTTADDYLRAHASFIAVLRDADAALAGAEGVGKVGNAVDGRKLADKTDAAQGAGLVGFNVSLDYPAGSIGQAIKDVTTAEYEPPLGGSLLSKIINTAAIRGLYVRNASSTSIAVGVGMSKRLNSVVEYRFQYDGDGLMLLRGVYSGVEDEASKRPAVTLSGSFITGSAPASYTQVPGDSFTATFTGSTLLFRSRVDDRGGIWRITLSNGMTRDISTWAATLKTEHEQVVFDKFDHGTYTVKCEFIGDDPFHAPSTSPSRGWIRYVPASTTDLPLTVAKVGKINTTTMKAIVSQNSVPDFAISARPLGAAYNSEWVPNHGSVTGVSYSPSIKVMIDGIETIGTPGTTLDATYDFREIEDFQIMQKFEARNPNGTGGSMWAHWVTHTLRKRDPVLSIKNRLEVLQDTRMTQIYFGMLPAASANVTRMALNDGTELSAIPVDNSEQTFGWNVTSAMYAGEFVTGNSHAVAVEVTSLRDSASFGTSYAQAVPGRISHRADGTTKIYWGAGTNVDVPAGKILRSEHRIGVVSGGRFPDDLFKSI